MRNKRHYVVRPFSENKASAPLQWYLFVLLHTCQSPRPYSLSIYMCTGVPQLQVQERTSVFLRTECSRDAQKQDLKQMLLI